MKKPSRLPLFPLTGSLLLPGGLLPLHIFEPRYCNMVQDAMDSDRLIGMVQPRVANFGDHRGDGERERPSLYSVGCSGLLDQVQSLPNDRYLIILKGRQRFRILDEGDTPSGYREATVDFDEFVVDEQDLDAEIDPSGLLAALEHFGTYQRLTIDIEKLEGVSGLALMNGLAMNLPFAPAEKQALLEADNAARRHQLLLDLLAMGLSHDNETAN